MHLSKLYLYFLPILLIILTTIKLKIAVYNFIYFTETKIQTPPLDQRIYLRRLKYINVMIAKTVFHVTYI